jgi:hypothetical protein
MAVDLGRFFDLLANPARLRIVGLLALESGTVEELAGLLGLKDESTPYAAVRRLRASRFSRC